MLGVLLLTLRELRAKWIVVGLFVIATLVWGTMALALQLDVVDGSLAGARIFGESFEDEFDESSDNFVDPEDRVAPGVDSLGVMSPDSLQVVPSDSLRVAPDSAALAQADVPPRAEPDRAPSTEPRRSDNPFAALTPLESLVFGAQTFVAGAAYWVGILLALFATGGLIASLQTKGEIDLLLSKPLSRSAILGGRLGGVALTTLALIAYLIGAVWMVMSLKSGLWNPRFLLAIPVIWAMFMVLYGIVTLVSVTTSSSALSLMVVLAVLFATLVLSIPNLDTQVSALWRPVVIGLKHALPRFPTVGTQLVPKLALGQPVGAVGAFAASLGIGAVLYGLSFWRFSRRDF